MSKNINELTVATFIGASDKLYFGKNPFGSTDDRAITFANFQASQFSPSKVLYVAGNGSDTTGTGTFSNPYRLTSKAIAAAVAAGASNTSRYLIITQAGDYNEPTNLEIYRPGIFHDFEDGVRLSLVSEVFENYFISAGWSGVAGAVCGVRGCAPILFGGCDVNIPYNGIAQLLHWECNYNAASDVMNFIVNNNPTPPASQSFLVLYNCDMIITQTVGFDIADNASRGYISSVVSGGYPDTNIYLNSSYLTQFSGSTEISSGAAANLNLFVNGGFISAVNLENSRPTGQCYFTASPGSYGTILRGISGGATVPPAIIVQANATYETLNADMLDKNYSFSVGDDASTNPRLKLKFKSGSDTASVYLGTKEIFYPVDSLTANRTQLSPNGAGFICGKLDNTGATSVTLTGQIPFDGATSIIDILVEGFVTGMATVGMTVSVAASWATLGQLDNTNAHSANVVMNTAADNTLVRFSIASIFASGATALTIGDIIGATLTTATAAKVLYVTGLVVLYT